MPDGESAPGSEATGDLSSKQAGLAGDVIPAHALRALFDSIGRDLPPDLRLLRSGTHTIFESQVEERVWRVSQGVPQQAIAAQLRAITALDGLPVLGPATLEIGLARPDYVMTEWERGVAVVPEAARRALALCLRVLHDAPAPALVSHRTPTSRIRAWITAAEERGAPKEQLQRIRLRADEVFPAMNRVITGGGNLVHGDAHPGNLIELRGRPLLIDLDDLTLGQWQLDLVPTAVPCDRFGLPQDEWAGFLEAYRPTSMQWPLWKVARQHRELTIVSWLASLWGGPGVEDELRHRLATWDLPARTHAPWRAI